MSRADGVHDGDLFSGYLAHEPRLVLRPTVELVTPTSKLVEHLAADAGVTRGDKRLQLEPRTGKNVPRVVPVKLDENVRVKGVVGHWVPRRWYSCSSFSTVGIFAPSM